MADIGAGTGKLTAMLVGLGADVTAVEPDPQMLAELRRAMPEVRSVPGSAEEMPLPDASVDAVLAGQAMHWFDMDRAMPEIARVLTPGGVFAGLWNVDDDRVGWVAELAEISKRKASITLLRWRDGEGRSRQQRLLEAGSGLFHAAEEGEFEHGQARTADSLLATIATHSHLLVMDEAERTAAARPGSRLPADPAGDLERRIHAADGHRRAAGAAQVALSLLLERGGRCRWAWLDSRTTSSGSKMTWRCWCASPPSVSSSSSWAADRPS